MRYVSMFLFSDNGMQEYEGKNYAQVTCSEHDSEVLENMGFVRSIFDHPKDPDLPNVDPEKGDGVVGSFEWHQTHVMSFEDKDDLENYIKEVTGIDIDKRGKLETVKKKALGALEEWQKQQHKL